MSVVIDHRMTFSLASVRRSWSRTSRRLRGARRKIFRDPAAGQDLKAAGIVPAADDVENESEVLGGPVGEALV
jgi:hypothetical protein